MDVKSQENDVLQPMLAASESIQAFSDGITYRVSTPGPVENRASLFSVGSTRRNSVRSSIASSDFQWDELSVPKDETELIKFVERVSGQCKSTSKIKEALLNTTWLKLGPQTQFGNKRMTVIHAAAKLGEFKFINAFLSCEFPNFDMDCTDSHGNTAMHIAAEENKAQVIEALLKNESQAASIRNRDGWTPIQFAAAKCHQSSLEVLIKHLRSNNPEIESQKLADLLWHKTNAKETLLHLACRFILIEYRDLKDSVTRMVERGSGWDEPDGTFTDCSGENYFRQMDILHQEAIKKLEDRCFPVLELLLKEFVHRPELVEDEDGLPSSPGKVMHYFASFNYLNGLRTLLGEDFTVSPKVLNKHRISPLWIAAQSNFTEAAIILLEFSNDPHLQADPNCRDPFSKMTPLHLAVHGYHVDRVEETSNLIDALLRNGADPSLHDESGETAAHLSVKLTRDFKIMSKFLDHLGHEALEMVDDSGNTLFHYAVCSMDEVSILKLIEKGAGVMNRNFVEVPINDTQGNSRIMGNFEFDEFEMERGDSSTGGIPIAAAFNISGDECAMKPLVRKAVPYKRESSLTHRRLPLQEAIRNGNSQNYFNAIRRIDFNVLRQKMSPGDFHAFICTHIVGATKEVRPDIVRLLFQQIRSDPGCLHSVLLYSNPQSDDEMFTKTALEWAVENNDRLCTTEILHQEYECHKESKFDGLICLKRQITGDELLMWTIETFTLFYERTWAQRYGFPIMKLFPLLFSFFIFVYDFYSDVELTREYYDGAFGANHTETYNRTLDEELDCSELFSINGSHVILPTNFFQHFSVKDMANLLAKCFSRSTPSAKAWSLPSPDLECADIVRESPEYRTAFIVNILCIAVPLFIFYVMCAREFLIRLRKLENRMRKKINSDCLFFLIKGMGRILWLCPLSVICAPFFIIYIPIRQVYFKFHHNRAKRKNKFRRQLQKSEYLWGISRTSEAGLESCGQIILQVWLLSSDFNYLSRIDFGAIVDKTYNGIIFFLSFSLKPADDIEKSLGKMFMSFLALVCGVAACYRTLKRGAVGFTNTAFIYMSLLLQIFARIFSIGLFFFAVRSFFPVTLILLIVHFALVFTIKRLFEKSIINKGMLSHLVAAINVFANSLVYVRIVPIERSTDIKRKHEINAPHAQNVEEHRTFIVQTLFFLLVLIENLLLASTPLFFNGKYNRAYACLGQDKLIQYVGIVFGMNVFSWFFHIGYYKYMGHPWSSINGPRIDKGKVRTDFFAFGKLRRCEWTCTRGNSDTQGNVGCCKCYKVHCSFTELNESGGTA